MMMEYDQKKKLPEDAPTMASAQDFYGESERGKLRKRISERMQVIFFFKKNDWNDEELEGKLRRENKNQNNFLSDNQIISFLIIKLFFNKVVIKVIKL